MDALPKHRQFIAPDHIVRANGGFCAEQLQAEDVSPSEGHWLVKGAAAAIAVVLVMLVGGAF